MRDWDQPLRLTSPPWSEVEKMAKGERAVKDNDGIVNAATETVIEITEEMLDRGVEAFLGCRDLMYETAEEGVILVMRAIFDGKLKLVEYNRPAQKCCE